MHGNQAWICSVFSSQLFQYGSSSIIFLWNTGQTQVSGTLEVLLVIRSILILSPRTSQKLSFARICVEVGVDCEFPKSLLLDLGNGKYSKIRIEYPWAPQCCSNCKLFGHNVVNCHAMKRPSCKAGSINPGNNENVAGEEGSAGARKDPPDTGEGSRKESTGDTLVNAADRVVNSIVECRGAIEPTVTYADEVIRLANEVNHPKLPGNTFECLAQSEEECPSEAAKSIATSRSDPNTEFFDTSPILDTFKHIKRVDELDFTPVPLSKKLKKLKKQNLANKQDPVVGGSSHIPHG